MQKKKYYTAQESAYKKIQERGEVGWQKKSMNEFRDPQTDHILKQFVTSTFTSTSGLKALDLGTGSGPTAHALFELGFLVTGIDVCPSAINLAKEIAERENKEIHFLVADAIELNSKFDLIYDSHCTHCIVLEDDRAKFFKTIYNSLTENGIFILDSMALEAGENWNPNDGLLFDNNYILWHRTSHDDLLGVVKINDSFWCPQRRIYPVTKIFEELKEYGFRIINYSIDAQEKGEPLMLRALCTKG